MDLVEFLTARYDEEAAPRALPAWHEAFCLEPTAVDRKTRVCLYCGEQEDLTKVDYVPQSPKKLADIDAKRRILAAYEEQRRLYVEGVMARDVVDILEREVLRPLALPYASHPDYDESWRL